MLLGVVDESSDEDAAKDNDESESGASNLMYPWDMTVNVGEKNRGMY
jgi:hypothetical protein